MTRKHEAGQVLIFAALGLGMLLGAAGLGVDMGVLRYERRLQQTAADAAAVAGASNLLLIPASPPVHGMRQLRADLPIPPARSAIAVIQQPSERSAYRF